MKRKLSRPDDARNGRAAGGNDKFVALHPVLITPPCQTCQHRVHPLFCTAFPGGIPADILTGRHDHRTPFSGDHGVRYSPKAGAGPLRKSAG